MFLISQFHELTFLHEHIVSGKNIVLMLLYRMGDLPAIIVEYLLSLISILSNLEQPLCFWYETFPC